jgi:hypothetical protein
MTTLTLTNSNVIVLVSDEDRLEFAFQTWCLDTEGYVRTTCRQHEYLHVILGKRLGYKLMTDHKDRNKLNNQRSNLREANNSQNQANSKKKQGCTSRYKGVSWSINQRKWKASIKLNGKLIHLGVFKDEILAAKAYNKAALLYFGDFANLNEVSND